MYPDPALSLMRRFLAGDPKARAAVRQINARAATDPAARRAATLLAQHCPCPLPGAQAAAGCATPSAVGAWEGLRWLADELRPHSPMRPGAEAFTTRKAYREGIDALAGCDVPAAVGAWEGTRWLADELRPHSPMRPGAEAFTARKAYRGGIEALSTL